MHRQSLLKPDGRALTLYARAPLPPMEAPSPSAGPQAPHTYLRWHALRGEWVAYASHRQHRTFLPPPEYNPLAPHRPGEPPTEVPAGPWDVSVFDNLFPTFAPHPGDPPALEICQRREGAG